MGQEEPEVLVGTAQDERPVPKTAQGGCGPGSLGSCHSVAGWLYFRRIFSKPQASGLSRS